MLWFNESLSHQSICNDCRVLDIELSHPWGQIELKAGTFLENHCQIRVVTWVGTIFSLSVPYWGPTWAVLAICPEWGVSNWVIRVRGHNREQPCPSVPVFTGFWVFIGRHCVCLTILWVFYSIIDCSSCFCILCLSDSLCYTSKHNQ